MTGTCALSLLSDTDFSVPGSEETVAVVGGTVTIGEVETYPDICPGFTHDVSGGATLIDFPFSTVSCLPIDLVSHLRYFA